MLVCCLLTVCILTLYKAVPKDTLFAFVVLLLEKFPHVLFCQLKRGDVTYFFAPIRMKEQLEQ